MLYFTIELTTLFLQKELISYLKFHYSISILNFLKLLLSNPLETDIDLCFFSFVTIYLHYIIIKYFITGTVKISVSKIIQKIQEIAVYKHELVDGPHKFKSWLVLLFLLYSNT